MKFVEGKPWWHKSCDPISGNAIYIYHTNEETVVHGGGVDLGAEGLVDLLLQGHVRLLLSHAS